MSNQLYTEIGQKFADEYGTSLGQLFRKPCLKNKHNKAFAAFYKDEMAFKLGKEAINLIIDRYPGAINWDPSGKKRPMKDWLQVPSEYSIDWKNLAKEALEFTEVNK